MSDDLEGVFARPAECKSEGTIMLGICGEFVVAYGATLLAELTIAICAACWARLRGKGTNDQIT